MSISHGLHLSSPSQPHEVYHAHSDQWSGHRWTHAGLFLAKAGARITVVEKSKSLLSHGQNVDIEGSAITIIRKMGLLDKVRQSHTRKKAPNSSIQKDNPLRLFPFKDGISASLTSEFEILRGGPGCDPLHGNKRHPNVK